MRTTLRFALSAALAASMSLPWLASAQEEGATPEATAVDGEGGPAPEVDPAEVERFLAEGASLREEQNDEEAIARFRQAYEASGETSGQAMAELALAERALERWMDAVTHFDRALELGGEWVEQLRGNLERAREDCLGHLARLSVTTDAEDATLTVDGEDRGALPLEAPIVLSPGSHEVRVSIAAPPPAEGEEAAPPTVIERTVELAEGELSEQRFEQPTPEPPEDGDVDGPVQDTPEDEEWGDYEDYDVPEPIDESPSTGVWALTAVAAVGLATGTVFGFVSLSEQSAFDDLIAQPSITEADVTTANDIAQRGETFGLLADLGFGITIAAGATALVLYIVEQNARRAEAEAAEDEDGEDADGDGDGDGDEAADDESAFQVVPWADPRGGLGLFGGMRF